jgi:hypothetical protein
MCTPLTVVGLIVAAALLPLTPAGAAEITARGDDVTISGEIKRGDDEAFVNAVTSAIKTVYLTSPGGDLVTSMKIARLIKAWKLETVVGHYAHCASGCAIVWFAGETRRIMTGGHIGLHAASTKEEGRRTRSDRGTEVMVKFLRLLDVPEAILALVEQTGPTAMHWINRVEASEMGLSTLVPPTPAVESYSPPPTERKSPAWLWDAQRGYERQWGN